MTHSSTILLVSLAILVVSLQGGRGAPVNKKLVYIQMTNVLPGQVNLTIHCKSGDDDLGSHVVASGEYWGFQFRANIWGSTLYFCSFEWPGNVHSYDIYKEDYRRPGCHDCFWNILPDGPCLFNYETKKYDFCDHWNPPEPSSM